MDLSDNNRDSVYSATSGVHYVQKRAPSKSNLGGRLGRDPVQEEFSQLFDRPVCVLFEPVEGDERERCHCGNVLTAHKFSKLKPPGLHKWDPMTSLIVPALPEPRPAIKGVLKFVNEIEGDCLESQFACVGAGANAELMLKYMSQLWNLEPPSLIVSIYGGQDNSRLDQFQKDRIRQGILKAVSTTNSWLLTSGTHQGMTKVLADAVKQAESRQWTNQKLNKITCIGMNTWGCVDNHEAMQAYFSHPETRDKGYKYKVRQRRIDPGIAPLNPNHSCFILADNGRREEPDAELQMRLEMEHTLSRTGFPSHDSTPGAAIPLVVVCVGGLMPLFEAISTTLKHGIPVVLCDGLGGASDVILAALRNSIDQGDGGKILIPEKSSVIKKMIKDSVLSQNILDNLDDPEIDTIIENEAMPYIQIILQFTHLITDFKLNKSHGQELDGEILRVLLKGDVAKNFYDPLELALNWNRDDVAAQDVLAHEMDLPKRPNIDRLMLKAIMEGKTNFVKLFMESGFVMKDFLIQKRLQLLYNYAAQTNEVLAYLLKKTTAPKKTERLGRKKNPRSKHYSLRDVSKLIFSLSELKNGASNPGKGGTEMEDLLRTFDDPFGKLCIWAVLANKMEMSEFFWGYAKEPVMLALVCSRIWNSLASRLWPGEDVFQPEFEANADDYTERAVGVIDVCYRTDHDLARHLIEQPSFMWPGRNRMDVAVSGECKEFLATACVQAAVDAYWRGGLRCSPLKILMCLLCPPLIATLAILPDDEEKAAQKKQEQEQKKNNAQMNGAAKHPPGKEAEAETLLASNNNGQSQSKLRKLSKAKSKPDSLVTFTLPKTSKETHNTMPFIKKVKTFYTAPVTKFAFHSGAFISFLLFFSYMVLTIDHANPDGHFYAEIAILVMAFTYLLEEIRQLVTEDAKWSEKLKSYLSSEWNMIDLCYLLLIICAFVTGRVLGDHNTARILYGFVTLFIWIRVIRLYQAVDRLGPLWIMMRKMFKEMLIFITVLVVFLLAYGVCAVTLVFKSSTLKEEGLLSTLEFALLIPALQMFGELFLDTIVVQRNEEKAMIEASMVPPPPVDPFAAQTCTILNYSPDNVSIIASGTGFNFTWDGAMFNISAPAPVNDTINPISGAFVQNPFQASMANWLLAAYLLIGNVLILNLLIAIFGHIYEVVQENSTIEWKNEMFLLCQEFQEKPILPPPFSVFETVVTCIKDRVNKPQPKKRNESMTEKLRIFESYCTSRYRNERMSSKSLEENIRSLAEHADTETEKIADMINVIDHLRQDLEPQDKVKKKKEAGGGNEAQTLK